MTSPANVATATGASPTGESTGAPPSSGGSPTGAQDTGFRFTPGPNVPDWAVGKTATEVLELSKQMYGALQGGYRPAPQPTYPPPQQPQAYPNPQMLNPQPAIPSNDEWLTDPGTAFQKAMGAMQVQQFAPVIEQMANSNAANSRALAEQRFNDDFKRFGPEIQMELSRVPVQMQTYDNIKYVVDLVRGRHAQELANELAERKVQERLASGTLRPGGLDGSVAPAEATGVDFTKLPSGYQAILERAGVKDVRDLDRFLLKYYGPEVDLPQARKDWFDKASKGNVVVESFTGAGYRREA